MAEFMTGTEFYVTFDVELTISFSKVANVAAKIELGFYVEGGRNDFPVFFAKPKKTPDTIIFEKGVIALKAEDGAEPQKDPLEKFQEGTRVRNVTIVVNNHGVYQRSFWFETGLIVSRGFSELNAMGNAVFIERIEIAHSGLVG